ncbi:hypothetical protein [Cystobacter ferrugineus]|uniref:hypothetical protein n=1 Tax=Cystobacter ferrugineus TaxID=83449 RepID=UPI001160FE7C|nr:hypothetical protein [Cystobacter ferrugineus]
MALIQDGFIHLAVVGGLCGERGSPLAPGFSGDVELWEVDDWIEWRFGVLDIDSRSASLLLNLCEWGAFNIAPALQVEVQAEGLTLAEEPAGRPLPQRASQLSFEVDERDQRDVYSSIQVEFVHKLSGAQIIQISHLLQPWHTALFRWGFSLPALAPGSSVVRPEDPPIVIAGDLWCWNFETFTARYEAFDVFLNCLERIHHTLCPVRAVAID